MTKLKSFGLFLSLIFFFALGYLAAARGVFIHTLNQTKLDNSLPFLSQTTGTSQLDFSLLQETYRLLKSHYLDSSQLNKQDLIYGAAQGMVSALGDPYTSFFNPKQNKEFKDDLAGNYEGIGAQLGYKNQKLVIVSPLENSPAQKAGVKAGDVIMAVDGHSTDGMSLPEAVNLIRGKAGSKVVLALAREGESKILDLPIKRERITVDSILLGWVGKDKSIAHLKILRFGDDMKPTWDKIVQKINRKQAGGVILDVRNNPGGYLEASIYLASEFFSDGVVVMKEETGGKRQEFKVDHAGRLVKMPVVVLINGGSASASEILAGSLKVRNRAKLVGQKSFGKGTVQEAYELTGGVGVHITIARWLLPNGKNIHKVGIKPNFSVPITDKEAEAGQDPQLDKAVELLQNST